jgi:hypothetical protein
MTSRVEWQGLPKLVKQLRNMTNLDCTPLMNDIGLILVEGNRRGVLSGLDGFDQPMDPLRYRGGAGVKTANRQKPHYGTTRYASAGGTGGGLTSSQYRQLTGPRLAPRGEASRVIKNLHVEVQNPAPGRWVTVAAWHHVVSAKGVDFLKYHFAEDRGKATFPRYDLRPIRPRDFQFCLNKTAAFAKANFFEGI